MDQSEPVTKPKLDLKFLEELLLSDIQTALARLQDTLKRVDIGALTKYNSTLDPTNKLHLLRLISNLLAKLKIPEDAIKSETFDNKPQVQRRNRSERHTIGVSKEELARARKWLEERNLSPNSGQSIPEFDFRLSLPQNQPREDTKKNSEKIPENLEKAPEIEKMPEIQEKFDQVHEKYMKDAINQQQSLQNRTREPKEDSYDLGLLDNSVEDYRLEDNYNDQIVPPFYQQPSAPKYNKFLAKKSRIKRANTIDIPNYLKLQSERSHQNGCISLRRPIDISDKVVSNGANVIPSFQPKTENDRKFLALINKNNETGPPVTSVPFKNFAYRQNSVADKNWNNRFSHIKTAFDKQSSEKSPNSDKPENFDKHSEETPKVDNKRKSIVNNEDVVLGSLRLSYGPAKISNGFTHAPTSPFQKIEKPPKTETPAFLKPGYIPKGGSNLQAKVKMFDQEQNQNPPPPLRTKGKLLKTAENIFNINHDDKKPEGVTENGHLNYHSFCKQFAPKGSSILNKPSHLELAKSKFTVNDELQDHKEFKKMPFISSQNGPFQKSKEKLLKMQEENQEPQKHFQKQYDVYPVNVNSPNIPNHGYRYDHTRSDQKSKNHPKNRFENPENNRTCESSRFSKLITEPVRSSIGIQTGALPYQEEKARFEEAKRRSSNATVQTSELYDNSKKPLNYQCQDFRNHGHQYYPNSDHYYNSERRGSTEIRVPLDANRKAFEPSRMQLESSRMPQESSRMPLEPSGFPLELPRIPPEPLRPEQTGPPIPERTNYGILLRNYKTNQTPRSKSSYYEYDENPNVPPVPIRSNSIDKIPRLHFEEETKPEEEFIPNMEHIQNQDISPDGVVTRYTCAIATVASIPDSLESFDEAPKPRIPPYPIFNEKSEPKIEPPKRKDSQASFDEIQRHNLLQQNLIRRMQENADKSPTRIFQEIPSVSAKRESPSFGDPRSPTSPSFIFGNKSSRHGVDSGEGRRTQEKISMFEERNNPPVKRHFRPLNVPRADLTPPRINVVNPSKVVHPKFKNAKPILNSVSPVDSSDEYLMSCANRPSRNIVLTKSESWHQLALSKTNLSVPSANSSSLMKPPKPKSPSSLRLSKQFEASSSSDNIKKMEERIQRYFQGPGGTSVESKKEVKSRRTLAMKKNSNSLMRSHTMPHIYDDNKSFDESADVEKAFDSLFKETTRNDNRY